MLCITVHVHYGNVIISVYIMKYEVYGLIILLHSGQFEAKYHSFGYYGTVNKLRFSFWYSKNICDDSVTTYQDGYRYITHSMV